MWATEHALIDPFRYQFTSTAFKAVFGAERFSGAAQVARLMPPWMLEAGYGTYRIGASELQGQATTP
jgi:hypothetical protein